MKVLELFAGTCSFSNVASKMGHDTFTSDYDRTFMCDYTVDIMDFDINRLPWKPDIIWASPPCTCFSVASLGHHWTGGKKAYIPKTKEAEQAILIAKKTMEIIETLNPKYYIIENPRGLLRKLDIMKGTRDTVTYCQYGDTRMKPTDLWHNLDGFVARRCYNGMTCHEAAPRGSKTGTQGLKDAAARAVIPPQLCKEILECIGKAGV